MDFWRGFLFSKRRYKIFSSGYGDGDKKVRSVTVTKKNERLRLRFRLQKYFRAVTITVTKKISSGYGYRLRLQKKNSSGYGYGDNKKFERLRLRLHFFFRLWNRERFLETVNPCTYVVKNKKKRNSQLWFGGHSPTYLKNKTSKNPSWIALYDHCLLAPLYKA